MNKLLILQGIPASGKSTFVKQWVEFDISLEEALERNNNREFSVGEKVINQFYNKYCI